MLRKITLLSILSCSIIINGLNAGPNRVVRAAINTVNFIDATIFATGLVGIMFLSQKRPMLLSRFCEHGACSYLMNSMIGIRILVEACRMMKAATGSDDKNQKNDLQKMGQCIDGLVTSTIFSQLAFSLLDEANNVKKNDPQVASALAALGIRCLAHLNTTMKPAISYLQ